MTTVTFVTFNGVRHTVDAKNDRPLMQAAVQNAVPGIDADCGGECMCATCHVIVEQPWFDKTGGPGPGESVMLAPTPGRTPTSRLSCQIKVTDALNGLVVHLPEFQM